MAGFIAVGYFLVTLFFSLVLLLLWARLFLRFCKISALDPIGQAVYSFTEPFVGLIARRLPAKLTKPGPYDWACFILILFVEFVKFILLGLLIYKTMIPLGYLILFIIADLLIQPCNLLFYILLIRVVMSWVNPHWNHPLAKVIKIITDPLLAWGRHLIPDISGFDFSPYLILIILKALTLFMSASLPLRLA